MASRYEELVANLTRDNMRMHLLYEMKPPKKNLLELTQRLYWFFRMVDTGGPDGSDLDDLTYHEASDAARILGDVFSLSPDAVEDCDIPEANRRG